MTDKAHPDPMVPADVDLRGLEYMPLLGAKLFSSDFNLDATDAEFRRALVLWWAAWNQQPAASLPSSERQQAKLAGFEDEKSPNWRKVRGRVLHGFVLCSDGRLYHPILAKQALIAWERRVEDRAEREGGAARKRAEREERSQMFEQLKAAGVVPEWNIKTADLRKLFARHVTVTGHGQVTQPVTVTVTAKTGRDGTKESARPADSTGVGRACDPDLEGLEPTPAGRVCRALRAVGVENVNPGHATLAVLLDAGATESEFVGAAAKALGKHDPFGYVLATVHGQREDAAHVAAGVHRGPLPGALEARAWDESAAGVIKRGAELGLHWSEDGWVGGEHMHFPAFTERVRARDRQAQQAEHA